MKLLDRAMRRFGWVRQTESGRRFRSMASAFAAAGAHRLLADWNPVLQSADVETRGALLALRARSRSLVNNSDYAKRILYLLRQNVVGPKGIGMQASYEPGGQLDEAASREIERAWSRWGRRGVPTTSGKHSFADVQHLVIAQLARDGEVFLRKVKGFPYNPFRYALQFIDPDRVDVNYNVPRRAGSTANEIRMGVEVDAWERPVRYYVMLRHPSEGASGMQYEAVPASEMIHLALVGSGSQTRGVPLLHTAMVRLHMLSQYEEAELIAARVGACMMAFFVSKAGDEFVGEKNAQTGAIEFQLEPGAGMQLPEGVDVKEFSPGQPDPNSPEFKKRMLQGGAAGANVSYASMTGDLREVNYSSIRQGVLDERDGYRMMQQMLVEHLCDPIFSDWVGLALLSGQLRIAPPATSQEYEALRESCSWQPRGWTWVDPLKDVEAALEARAGGIGTLQQACAERGLDWRETIDQIAAEEEYARQKGVTLQRGSGGSRPAGDPGAPAEGQGGMA